MTATVEEYASFGGSGVTGSETANLDLLNTEMMASSKVDRQVSCDLQVVAQFEAARLSAT
jgi:hypothetical protein